MVERDAGCPECGDPLSVSVETDEDTEEIKIRFFCEGAGDDVFEFQILTGLTSEDLDGLTKRNKKVRKEMFLQLLRREKEPEQ